MKTYIKLHLIAIVLFSFVGCSKGDDTNGTTPEPENPTTENPNTGTPVAGGFKLEEINYLFFKVVESGKRIVGFDLNEVAPGNEGDWDANVGARALWNLVCAVEKNRRLFQS